MTHCKLLIIGSGPAGYTAAIYASRAGLEPLLIEGEMPGGLLTTTTVIENFPGFADGVDGNELMMNMRAQAERFGTKILGNVATHIDATSRPFRVTLDDNATISASAIVLATGARPRMLGLEGEGRFVGSGLSTCATCDGFFYRGRRVAVVGGGDTAAEEALYLSSLANEVLLIVRRNQLRAQPVMQQRVLENKKIKVLWDSQIARYNGVAKMESISIRNVDGSQHDEVVDGVFLAIGHEPQSQLVRDIVEVDALGYVLTRDKSTATTCDGLFACGDVADPTYRQAINAAASGCRAAKDAEAWLAR